MVLFRYRSLGGYAAMPDGLHASLCHAFLVIIYKNNSPLLAVLAMMRARKSRQRVANTNEPVTGSLPVRPQPGHTPHLLPTFAISVLYLAICWRS